MKEATGEMNMTVVTIIAIGAIIAFFWFMWPTIKNTISVFDKRTRKRTIYLEFDIRM